MSILGYFFAFFFAKKVKKSWFFAPKRGSKNGSNPDGFLFANLNFWRFFFSTLIWLLKNCRGGSDPVRDACTLRRNHVFRGHDFRFLPRRIWPVPRRTLRKNHLFSARTHGRTFGFQGSRMGISASRKNPPAFFPEILRNIKNPPAFFCRAAENFGHFGANLLVKPSQNFAQIN